MRFDRGMSGPRRLPSVLALLAASGAAWAQPTVPEAQPSPELREAIAFERAARALALELAPARGWTVRDLIGRRHVELAAVVRGVPTWRTTLNTDAADTVGADELHPGGSSGHEVAGLGVLLGIWDGGATRTSHQEFVGRALQVDSPAGLSDHATHVAGTMMAGGVDPVARGMAYAAVIDCYDWNDDVNELDLEGAFNNLRVSNHSYGQITGWYQTFWDYGDGNGVVPTWAWFGHAAVSPVEDNKAGLYTWRAVGVDQVAYDNPKLLQCWSAGNDRNDYGPGPGGRHIYADPFNGYQWTESFTTRNADGPWDCISPAQIAKNVLTVGAIRDIPGGYRSPGDVVLASFSSAGPADDGRIKPDIVANGVGVYSTVADHDAAYEGGWSGTSMAAPNTSGTLGLLLNHWRNEYGGGAPNDPLASTLKALVIHTAGEAGATPGPDYEHGWGVLDAVAAADHITLDQTEPLAIQERTLAQGETYELELDPTPGAPELRVTCVWTDPPGAEAPWALDPITPALVNDLDVRLFRLDAPDVHYPWRLNRNDPAAPATNFDDNDVDNVEQIVVPAPPAGARYRLTVSHKGTLANGPQAYSLLITGVTDAPTPACKGDIDLDGRTDIFDFAIMADNFAAGPGATRDIGDLNGDGFVNTFDFAELAEDFSCGY